MTITTAFWFYLDLADGILIALFVLITLINCGALLEQRRWIYYLECVRLIFLFGFVFYKLDWVELIFLPTIALIILERTFALSSLYRSYVLRYEEA
ncbi:hypothetical protein E6A44_019055 [Pedobacter ureilyticus]|uniref:Uncharacterized protein n=1 Tax=Pedobacter ureilyticus TaxID=1393051 RepID=A0ABW9JF05_9SPHI|nr:hypothetical protein [Pedobacter helvus]